MDNVSKFYIEKDNKRYTAYVLTNFIINEKEYCMYTVNMGNKDFKLFCAKKIGGNIIPITDKKESDLVNKIVKKFANILKSEVE